MHWAAGKWDAAMIRWNVVGWVSNHGISVSVETEEEPQ
jgi:hypothetical protein